MNTCLYNITQSTNLGFQMCILFSVTQAKWICTIQLSYNQKCYCTAGCGLNQVRNIFENMKIEKNFNQTELRLSKMGFKLKLFGFTTFIAVTGIFVSLFGLIIGGALVILPRVRQLESGSHQMMKMFYGASFGLVFAVSIGWLIMSCLLLRKSLQKNVDSIEKIAKNGSYASGSLEILTGLGFLIFNIISVFKGATVAVGNIVISSIHLSFMFLKIHGIRKYEDRLMKAYIIYRYVLFCLFLLVVVFGLMLLHFFVLPFITRSCQLWCHGKYYSKNLESMLSSTWTILVVIVGIVVVSLIFLQDIGITIILQSIRQNKKGKEDLNEIDLKDQSASE